MNGTTIRQDLTADQVDYFHVEFENPEVIFTNGAPTESYVDHGNRHMFQIHREFQDLYGEVSSDGMLRERRFAVIGDGPRWRPSAPASVGQPRRLISAQKSGAGKCAALLGKQPAILSSQRYETLPCCVAIER